MLKARQAVLGLCVPLLIGGCGATPVPAPRPAPPSASTSTDPTVADIAVTGTASGPTGKIYQGVSVGFKRNHCAKCSLVTAKTDTSGAYAVRLTPGTYVAACLATPYGCAFKDSQDVVYTLEVTSDRTVDVVVKEEVPDPQPGPDPGPDPTPDPQPGPGTSSALSGHVRTNEGRPVPGITIQLLPPGRVGQTLFTTAVTDGSYAFDAASGVYTAVCVTPDPTRYMCGPAGGDGTGPTVNLAQAGQVVEFILCRSQDYPACLRR